MESKSVRRKNIEILIVICVFVGLYILSFRFSSYLNQPYIFQSEQIQIELAHNKTLSTTNIQSKIIECRDFSDLTAYCLYENVCIENNQILYLTNDKKLLNTNFEYYGHINSWDHYEPYGQNGKVIDKEVNNPLPFRAFLNGKYVNSSVWNQSEVHKDGCHSILSFDFTGHNIFHWSMKVSPLFLFQYYNKKDKPCQVFKSIRLINRQSSNLNDWQRTFLELATGLEVNTENIDFTNEPNRKQANLQCFKHLVVPGTAIYIFTGPKEAIAFRQRVSKSYNITFERGRVVIVKRKNRLIVNQEEFENFVKMKVGENLVDVIYLEELNFVQQVEKMSKASLLIAVHGAGLTNGIFLPSTSTIIEITSPHFLYPLYERVSTQSGHLFYRFVTQFDPSIHSNRYANLNGRECFRDPNCIVHWKDASIKVNITKFSVLFEQVMESF